jgi:hypothetical protein
MSLLVMPSRWYGGIAKSKAASAALLFHREACHCLARQRSRFSDAANSPCLVESVFNQRCPPKVKPTQ